MQRISSGLYRSRDGRAVIQRQVSQQTGRPAEISWSLHFDGKQVGTDFATKKEAIDRLKKHRTKQEDTFIAIRAARGMSIVHSTERYKNSKDNLADVLTDLLHYAAKYGKDFEKELEIAKSFFKEDCEVVESSKETKEETSSS